MKHPLRLFINVLTSKVRQQRALGLVEALLVLSLTSLLGLGFIDILLKSNESYRLYTALSQMQEDGEFAIDFLIRDVRDTDFWGCLSNLSNINNQLNTGGVGYNQTYLGFTTSIDGASNLSASPFVSGSDSITISAAQAINGGSALRNNMAGSSDSIQISNATGLGAGDILLVSDCLQGDIFQATQVNSNTGNIQHQANGAAPGNNTASLSKAYGTDAFLYLPYTHTYSVQINTEGNPALFLTDRSSSEEIVENIENMVILYGEDLDGDGTANRYVRAQQVNNFDDVVSVRINLLIRSTADNLLPAAGRYTFNGQTIQSTDRRLRRIYSRTVVLRNKAF